MEYFSEIYGKYYLAAAAVLKEAFVSPLSEKEITEIVSKNAFGESALYIVPKLISEEWPLLKKQNGLYSPAILHEPKMPMTALQKSWLAAVLDDTRCKAFLTDSMREEIKEALDIESIYDSERITVVDAASDGDDFSSAEYRERLDMIFSAIEKKGILRIHFVGGKGCRVSADFVPCRLEYSPKDDKLRLHAVKIRKGKASVASTINLGRIESISDTGRLFFEEIDIDTLLAKEKASEPAVIELTDERNALERFMVQFASYDKHTKYIEENDKYICSVFYNRCDETELLIRLLSFGPVIKILSPENLVSQAKKRIAKQFELMERCNYEQNGSLDT